MSDRLGIDIDIQFDSGKKASERLNRALDNVKKQAGKLDIDIQFDKQQTSVIRDFAKKIGATFNKDFADGIKNNFNSGDIDRILSDSFNDVLSKVNSQLSKDLTQSAMKQYQGFINEIKGKSFSVNNIAFDKTELTQLKESIRGTLKIDKNAIGIDSLMEDIKKIGEQWGFAFDSDVIQDNVIQLGKIIGEFKNIKKNGLSAGLSGDEEEQLMADVFNNYANLIENLEKLEKAKEIVNKSGIDGLTEENKLIKDQIELINGTVIEKGNTKVNGNVTSQYEKMRDELGNIYTITKDINGESIKMVDPIEKTADAQEKLSVSLEAYKIRMNAVFDGMENQYKNVLDSANGSKFKDNINEFRNAVNNLNPSSMKEFSNQTKIINAETSKLKTNIRDVGREWSIAQKSANSFSGAIKDVLQKVGLFSLAYEGINQLKRSIRDGLGAVKEMDSAMTTLKITMDGMTNTSLTNMGKQSQQLARDLSSTTSKVLEAVTTFANASETIDSIMNKTGSAIILSNLTGLDTQSTVNTIQSATKQFEELSDGSEASAMKVTDSMVAISKALGLDFSIGVKEMSESISILGSLSSQLGGDLDDTLALISAGMEKLRLSGSELATSMKTIMVRTMRVSGEGITEDEFKNAEKALNDIGVKIRDLSTGEMRDFMDVMKDVSDRWDGISESSQLALGEALGGVRQLSQVLGTIKNMDRVEELANIGKNSKGAGLQAQEVWAESLDAKMQSLTNSTQIFWQNFFNSNLIKGSIDSLNTIIKSLDGMQNIFGSLSLTIGTATGAFLMFTKNPFKQFTDEVVRAEGFVGGFKKMFGGVVSDINGANGALNKAKVGLSSLGASFNTAGLSAVVATAKVAAFQAVLSMGLSLAITATVGLVTKLATSLSQSSKSMEDCEAEASNLASALDNVSRQRDMVNQYSLIKKQLENANLEESKRNDLKKELETIMQNLVSAEEGYYGILNNENLTLDEQVSKMERIQELKLFDEAKDLDKTMMSQGEIEKKVRLLEEYKETIIQIQDAIASGNEQQLIDLIGVSDIGEARDVIDELTNKVTELDGEVIKWNSGVALMNDANFKTNRSTIELSDSTEDFINKLKGSTDALDENTKAKENNANAGGDGTVVSIEEATKSYGQAISATKELQGYIDDINEAASMTPELIIALSEKFPELGARITDATATQQFLNDKISEQVTAQQQALEIMYANDENFYNNKIKNDENYKANLMKSLNEITNGQAEAYGIDFNNFKTLGEMKAGIMAQLGKPIAEWVAGLVGGNADAYAADLVNVKSWAEAKSKVLARLNEQINKINEVMFDEHTSIGKAMALEEEANRLKSAKEEIVTAFDDIGASFTGVSIPTFGGADFSTGGSGSGGSSSAEKQVADLELVVDRYRDLQHALEEINDELSKYGILSKNANDEDKIKYAKKEIELLNQKKKALEDIRNEQIKEQDELKKALSGEGFKFDSENDITNANARLKELEAWSNQASGDEKERRQGIVKSLQEMVKAYDDVHKNVSSTNNEILDIQNTVIDSQKEIADVIKNEYQVWKESEEKKTDKLKQEIQKRKDLMNKQWETEDFEDKLDSEQNKLNELYSARQDALRTGNMELVKQLEREIADQQKAINDIIRDKERDNANNLFDEKMDLLDKQLKEKLDSMDKDMLDDKLLEGVKGGATSLQDIFGNINTSSDNLNRNMLMVGDSIAMWNTNLDSFISKMNRMQPDLSLNLNGNIDGVTSRAGGQPTFNITTTIEVAGGTCLDEDTLDNILEKNNKEIIKQVNDSFKR